MFEELKKKKRFEELFKEFLAWIDYFNDRAKTGEKLPKERDNFMTTIVEPLDELYFKLNKEA